MWNDAIDLRDFYASPLGAVTRRVIRARLRQMWPDVAGFDMLGFGYATPYLGPFRGEARRVIAVMPAGQGVLHWPREGPGLVSLADETEIPLPDVSIDRVLLVHGLECSEQLRPMLREIWRVMTEGGRLLAVVPNRRGIWAQLDRTPFGHGHPYTPSQLSRLLRDMQFTPTRFERALYVPPGRSRMAMRTARAWEKVGARCFQTFAGVLMIEAGKQLYMATPEPATPRRRAILQPQTDGNAASRIPRDSAQAGCDQALRS